ncbi:MAG: hypothetical protein B6243_06740 [Anaerolineaceae bacterium 4572_5.2]|nr:MAG: hypothetical protein B6243_06740 [Anaerolineaceae bacterium 4572_5.2]
MTNDVSVPRKIDLNQADVETLAELSGIGAALAARIVWKRRWKHSRKRRPTPLSLNPKQRTMIRKPNHRMT